jgi:uncharacterized membrane protein YeaQ/YmgE (transglycosylase-associated protein family)
MPLSRAAVLQGVVAVGIAIGAVMAARIIPLRGSLRVLPCGVAMGVIVPMMTLVHDTSVAYPLLVIIGALAGWIAGSLVKGGGSGILTNILTGIAGALIGGFLLSFFVDTAAGGWWFTLFTAILGSVILLWILGKVRK